MVIARLEAGVEPARIEALTTAAREVNHVIVRRRQQSSDLSRTAATATLVRLWSDSACGPLRAAIVHVGDSRAVLVRAGRARQLTTDHAARGVLTRYLGTSEAEFACEVAEIDLVAGDVLLLATDGFFKPRAVNVADLLARAEGDAGVIGAEWLDAARRAGDQDDATAILIRLLRWGAGKDGATGPHARARRRRPHVGAMSPAAHAGAPRLRCALGVAREVEGGGKGLPWA